MQSSGQDGWPEHGEDDRGRLQSVNKIKCVSKNSGQMIKYFKGENGFTQWT